MENNYFKPGDIVVLNKDIDHKPTKMLVIGKQNDNNTLSGIICLFFDKNGQPYEYTFNTKDITKL